MAVTPFVVTITANLDTKLVRTRADLDSVVTWTVTATNGLTVIAATRNTLEDAMQEVSDLLVETRGDIIRTKRG